MYLLYTQTESCHVLTLEKAHCNASRWESSASLTAGSVDMTDCERDCYEWAWICWACSLSPCASPLRYLFAISALLFCPNWPSRDHKEAPVFNFNSGSIPGLRWQCREKAPVSIGASKREDRRAGNEHESQLHFCSGQSQTCQRCLLDQLLNS